MTKNFPLVSVIVPTFNEEKNIDRFLSSIEKQTFPNIEIIIVDDGSTDQTVTIAKSHAAKVYARTHAERSVQRNFGARKSRGQYLVFLDCDMELTPKVIAGCVSVAEKCNYKAITIAEKTVGRGLIAQIRRFERRMYEGDPNFELARFFDRSVFFEFKGYDPKLTGPEDYDLPYRIGKKFKIGRVKELILHHEEELTLLKLLKKKFYYANRGAQYATKHPELISIQGTILFRQVYLRHWREFIQEPLTGLTFLVVRSLETVWAVAGYISSVGILGFIRTLPKLFKK